jgi:spermidine/putrescine transport system permease protein
MKKQTIRAIFAQELPFFLSVPALLWQIIFFYTPLLFLVYLSLTNVYNYGILFDSAYLAILGRSLLLALVNAVLCLLCAYPIAYYIAIRSAKKIKNILLFFLLLPFFSGLLILIYAWFFVLEKTGLINTILLNLGIISTPLTLINNIGAIYVVMLYCYLPFMIMPIYAVLEKLDRRILDASADLGASGWITTLRITIPLSLSGIRTGFFLVFVPSFGEFVIPELVGGSKQFFIGSLIGHFFLEAHDTVKGATITCISGLILIGATAVLYLLFKRWTK